MPELPEVETVRRGLEPVIVGRRFTKVELRRQDLRFPFPDNFAERLRGTRIERLERRAKFLVATLSSSEVLTMHLGMTGRFAIESDQLGEFHHAAGGIPKHDHVVFHFDNTVKVTFNDVRRFGFMELIGADDVNNNARFASLGPEALSNSFSEDHLYSILKSKKSPIKSALLDQRVVAGLGNIYVCEALFRAGIGPARRCDKVKRHETGVLVGHIRDVLREAIDAGGSSISDFAQTDGKLGYFQHNFAVYGKAGKACQTCGTDVEKITQSGRSSFFCPKCQK
jgi:formamidopyrimidine-DNA glycosylase